MQRPPALPPDAHKGDAGRVLVFAGSREMPGAALLAGRAALRGGAGLVTLACLDEALLAIAPTVVPELIHWDLSAGVDALEAGLALHRPDVVLAGPGLGHAEADGRSATLLAALFRAWRGPLVLDADALNVLAERGDLRADLATRATPAVITPHPGEARRLLGSSFGSDPAARLTAARRLAADLECVTCLKGAATLVVDPRAGGPRTWTNTSGNPGMASAGTGDVLAGLVAAYLCSARDESFAAAKAAVYVHGLAGDRVAARIGRRALNASDLLDEIGPAQEEGPWS